MAERPRMSPMRPKTTDRLMPAIWYAMSAHAMAMMSASSATAIVGRATAKMREAKPVMNCPIIALARRRRSVDGAVTRSAGSYAGLDTRLPGEGELGGVCRPVPGGVVGDQEAGAALIVEPVDGAAVRAGRLEDVTLQPERADLLEGA